MWEDLSLKEKAEMMRIGILNGISDLNHIKEAYNEYSRGGYALWKKKIYKHKGINVDADNTYDYKGFYNAHPNEAWEMLKESPDYHFDDEYKTVYHPTFSTYSKYSGKKHPKYNPTKQVGGTWSNNGHVYTVNKDLYNGPVSMDDRMKYLSENEESGVSMREYDGTYPYLEDGSFWYGVLPLVTVEAPYKGRKKALGGNLFEDGGEEDVYADIYMDPPIDEPNTWPYMLYLNGVVVTPSKLDIEDIKIWNEAFPEGRPQELLKDYAREVSEGKDPNFFYHNLAKLIKASGSLNIKDWGKLSDKKRKELGRDSETVGRAYRVDGDQYLDYNNPKMSPSHFMEDYFAEESHLFNDKKFPIYYLFEGIRPDPDSGLWDESKQRYVNQDYNTPGGNEFNTHRVILPKVMEWARNPNAGEISDLVADIKNNYVKYATDAVGELQKKERKAGTGLYILEGFDVNKIQSRLNNIRRAIDKRGREYSILFGDPEKGKKDLEEEYRKEMNEELELRKKDKSSEKWWYNGNPNVPSRYTGRNVGMYGLGGQVNKFPLGGEFLPWFGPNYADYIDDEGKPFKYSNEWNKYSVLLPDIVVKGKRKRKK